MAMTETFGQVINMWCNFVNVRNEKHLKRYPKMRILNTCAAANLGGLGVPRTAALAWLDVARKMRSCA